VIREPSKKVGTVSRADLVDLLTATDNADSLADFAAIGFERKTETQIVVPSGGDKPTGKDEIKPQLPPEWTQFQPAPSQYWRACQITIKELPKTPEGLEVEISIRKPDEILREVAFSQINGLEFQPLAEPRYLLSCVVFREHGVPGIS
jgi:hypothetical protein